MANKFDKGIFYPKNRQKYIGKGFPIYRSSWERAIFLECDLNPAVLQWASESISIQYRDPVTLKIRTYIPDLFIKYIDKNNKQHGDVVEIKPYNQSVEEAAKSKRNKAAFQNNAAKWQAAMIWCKKQGLNFRVMTERQIFRA